MTREKNNELRYLNSVGKTAHNWVYELGKTSKEWKEKHINTFKVVNGYMIHFGKDVYEQIKNIEEYDLKYKEMLELEKQGLIELHEVI